MQTFLPYPDAERSAHLLDSSRLGKQRVECLQILSTLTGLRAPWPQGATTGPVEEFVPRGWVNHPAVRMWRGHIEALVAYALSVCGEWRRRGHVDTVEPKIAAIAAAHGVDLRQNPDLPPWWGLPELHLSHRSNLVRKDAAYYGELFPGVPSDLPYHWPV